jgi:hypothetical protein
VRFRPIPILPEANSALERVSAQATGAGINLPNWWASADKPHVDPEVATPPWRVANPPTEGLVDPPERFRACYV